MFWCINLIKGEGPKEQHRLVMFNNVKDRKVDATHFARPFHEYSVSTIYSADR